MPRSPRILFTLLVIGAAARCVPTALRADPIDTAVYRRAALALFDGTGLYADDPDRLPFTYPPFAAVVLAPLGGLSEGNAAALLALVQLAALVVLLRVVCRGLGLGWRHTWAWVAIGLMLAPVQRHLGLGQINLGLAALVALDLLVVPARRRGLLIGLAAGIKVVPGIFVLLLLIRRDWSGAGRAVLATGATAVLGWLVRPADSLRFWGELLWDPGRVGEVAYADNASVTGVLARLFGALGAGMPPRWLTLTAAGLVLLLGLQAMRLRTRAGDHLGAMVMTAVTGLMASPVSWSHHWIWLAVALPWLWARGNRGRVAAAGLATVCLVDPVRLVEALPSAWAMARLLAASALPALGLTLVGGALWRGRSGGVGEGSAQAGGILGQLLRGGVADPRPEEPAQAVALGARHDMQMQVRHRLTDRVVDRDE